MFTPTTDNEPAGIQGYMKSEGPNVDGAVVARTSLVKHKPTTPQSTRPKTLATRCRTVLNLGDLTTAQKQVN